MVGQGMAQSVEIGSAGTAYELGGKAIDCFHNGSAPALLGAVDIDRRSNTPDIDAVLRLEADTGGWLCVCMRAGWQARRFAGRAFAGRTPTRIGIRTG
jgi:hypothetical protein